MSPALGMEDFPEKLKLASITRIFSSIVNEVIRVISQAQKQ